MDTLQLTLVIISTLTGFAGLFFGFYRLGLKPQMENQLEFFKKKFEDIEDDIEGVKNAVENNTKTLSKHGERIASLETQVKVINGSNPGSEEEN